MESVKTPAISEQSELTLSTLDWRTIKWKSVNHRVRRMQLSIVKNVKANNWRKVRSQQRLLVRSLDAKLLAIRKVTSNKGKRTPGVDGKTWSTPESKIKAINELSGKGYNPKPLRRVAIPKKNGKIRNLGIPTMKDRAMQMLWKLALEPVIEVSSDLHSYGFRPKRSAHDCASRLHLLQGHTKRNCAEWVLEADIKSCFDEISHEWLLQNTPMDRNILKKWLKAGYPVNDERFPTETGTPQGGIISPLLANHTLNGMEAYIEEEVRKVCVGKNKTETKNRVQKVQVHLVRYADDFVITSSTKKGAEYLRDKVKDFLAIRGLALSEEKTKITNIADGYDFLGWNFREYDKDTKKAIMLIKPSNKSQKQLLTNIREIIKSHKTVKTEVLIDKLNPIIRGWGNYHQHSVAKQVFSKTDARIWQALWKWCKRRHPHKSKDWIKKKYFFKYQNRDWIFGKPNKRLLFLADIKIVRHVMIQDKANPYLQEYDEYFENRAKKKVEKTMSKYHQTIIKKQNGICPHCQDSLIEDLEHLHVHHIVHKKDGGSDKLENLIIVHEWCHRQLHAKQIAKDDEHLLF